MRVRAWCGKEGCRGSAVLTAQAPAAACPGCGGELSIRAPSGSSLDACCACGCPNLYVEKAFPQTLGCLAIAAGAALAIAFARPTYGLSFAGMIILDAALYRLVPSRTVCYACSAEHRDFPPNPRHRPHDLLIAGKYADPGASA